MRTKKAIVHGKHSRKRNNHVGSSYSNKNNSDTSKRHRYHTMKGGMGFIKKVARTIEDKFSGCAVSSKMFENTKCFEEELTKKINEAVSQFVISNYFKSYNVTNKLEDDRKELFTTIKRVLFPLLVNVMIMRENGELLDNVQWDLGYSALVTIIILKFIDYSIYKAAVEGNLVDFSLFEEQELKEQEKCLERLECSKLSPSSLSQILYYFFIENDTEKSEGFLGNLISRVNIYGNDYKIKQRGGSGTDNFVKVSNEDLEGFGDQQQPGPGPEPVYSPPPTSSPPTSTSPPNSPPPPPVPSTPRPNQSTQNLDILYSVAFPNEDNKTKAKGFLEALNKMYQGEEKLLEPDTFNKVLRFSLDDGSVTSLPGGGVTLFNICMNIYSSKMFNTDTNLSAVPDEDIEEALKAHGINRTQSKIYTGKKVCLSHEDHLLCVGKMPEYLTEFDIPKQFQHKEKRIDEMGWGQTEFAKLKLVVFTEPDTGGIQVGGSSEGGISEGGVNLASELAEADAKAREEADAKAREEADAKAREEAAGSELTDAKAREEAAGSELTDAERIAKAEVDAKAREEAAGSELTDAKAREEAAGSELTDAERIAKAEADAKAREEADAKAREEADAKERAEAAAAKTDRSPYNESGSKSAPTESHTYDRLRNFPKSQITVEQGETLSEADDKESSKAQTIIPEQNEFMRMKLTKPLYDTVNDYLNVVPDRPNQDYNPKAFSIHQRTDGNGGNMNKYLKKGEYFVKFRVPSLIRDKISKSGSDRAGVLGGKTTKKEKRMAFHYPIRFGPTFSKFVSLMLNGSRYYKSLEKAGHDIDKLVKMYEAYGKAQKNCDPEHLKVVIQGPNVPPNPRPVEPDGPSGPSGPSRPEGGNIYPDIAALLKGLEPELRDLILQIIRENPRQKFNNRALAQMIYELISALRISKLESETVGGNDDGGNNNKRNLNKDAYINELLEKNKELELETLQYVATIKRNNELAQETIRKLEAEIARLQQLLRETESEVGNAQDRLNREITELKATIVELEQELVKIHGENDKLRAELEKLLAKHQELQAENARLLTENQEIAVQMRANAEKVGELQQQLEDSQRTNTELQDEIARLRQELEQERQSNEALQAQLVKLESTLQSAENKLRFSNATIAELEAQLKAQQEQFELTMTQTQRRYSDQQRELARLLEQNEVLIADNDRLQQALAACEEEKSALAAANDELQRKLDECIADREAGGGFAPDRGTGPRTPNPLVITEQLKTRICETMRLLGEKNKKMAGDLSNQIIIHDNGTYRQITYSDVHDQCTIKGQTTIRRAAPSLTIQRLESNRSTPLIFSTQTGEIDVEAMLDAYNHDNLKINYKKSARNVPLKYQEGTLTIRPDFFPTRRGGTRTKKLNRVNKYRKKSKKINF